MPEANRIAVFLVVKLVARKVYNKYQILHSLSVDCLRLRWNLIKLSIHLFIFINCFILVRVAMDPKFIQVHIIADV